MTALAVSLWWRSLPALACSRCAGSLAAPARRRIRRSIVQSATRITWSPYLLTLDKLSGRNRANFSPDASAVTLLFHFISSGSEIYGAPYEYLHLLVALCPIMSFQDKRMRLQST